MREAKLSKTEREIENALLEGKYIDIEPDEFKKIAAAIAYRTKKTNWHR